MISTLAAPTSPTQKEAIRQAVIRSVKARNLYTEQVVAQLSQSLADAEDGVKKSILHYKTLGSLPDSKVAALEGLRKLEAEIAEITRVLEREQTLRFRKTTKESFKQGIYHGIEDLAFAQMPFYKDLTPDGIDKLSTRVFTLVDTDALDFMANYNVILAGDVNRELADGIKRVVMSGIATGKGVEGIVRDLGHVVKDPESFRHAGTKVFSKAQYRMEMIARTEILRAHNQGRIKFHREVGVQKLEWMTMEDERVCPVCGPLDGQVFPTDRFPQQPSHPCCRCSSTIAWPLVICGAELESSAADEPAACILPPHAIEEAAKAKALQAAKLKAAFEGGEIADLNGLTVNDLQTLCKENGISIARTKADFIKLLDDAEPGVDHSSLSGEALKAKLKEHKIGLLRTKDDLVKLLAQKQAALKQAQEIAEQLKKVPSAGGLHDLTVVELKEMAKSKGVSLNMTKQDVIELLDELEPGVDHSGLQGESLIAAKKKHHIGPLKNKDQLIKALEKKAGEDLAEVAKKEAIEKATKEALTKAQDAIEQAGAKVIVPPSPATYSDFLAAVKETEDAISKGTGLPQSLLDAHAKELALRKKLFHDQIAAMKGGDLKDLAKETKLKYWQWANKDELITLFTETDPAKRGVAFASIQGKHAAWQEKHGSKKKAAKPPSTPTVTPPAPVVPEVSIPEPVTAPTFTKKGSEFDAIDAAWTEKSKPGEFKYAGKAQVGGAHTKEFWTDGNGDKWMFKPIERSGDDFLAHGEEAAYKIARLIDPNAIEVRAIRLNGKLGSIQKWRTDLKSEFDFSGVNPVDLTTMELEQIQREHVIDWLVSNHDGHGKQFLRAKDGKVYGIDKGQAYKFLGSDSLSIDYHPNRVHGENEPYYNTVFRQVKAGNVQVDPSVTLACIREVEKIPEEDFLAFLRSYADGRFGKDEAGKKAFLDLALARKRNLRSDFEGFYGDVLGKKGFRFDDAVAAIPKKGRLGPVEEKILADVRTLGWQGKVLPIDEEDIEDQNALVFVESFHGKPRTVVKMKIRPQAEGKLLDAIGKVGIDKTAVKVGEPLMEDVFSDDILAAAKTINHHALDKKYNDATLEKMGGHLDALKKLAESSDPDVKKMAESYIAWIEKVQQARKDGGRIPEHFNPYLRKQVPAKKKAKDAPFTVRRTKVLHAKRELRSGQIVVVEDSVDNTALFRGTAMKAGQQYEITFPDGTRAVYRPWNDQNLYAQRGEFELILSDTPDPKELEKAMECMEALGLKANVASSEDAELLYLHKQAYVTKTDSSDPAYKKMIQDLDARSASKDERVREMRSFWEKKLGVKDLTKLSGYDPMGKYQMGFLDPKKDAGYRQQYRFDMSEADLEKQMKGYGLQHQITSGGDVATFLETVLPSNGTMVSTVEKLRVGVPVSGMSPEEDMRTGGASYFFTRIKKLPTAGGPSEKGLYFKKQLLRRMDAISYGNDCYGRVTDDHVTKNRGSTPSEWKAISRRSSNETIFKNSVTILDNIELIVAGSEKEKESILAVFQKLGITKLPDGRLVKDIVLVR